MEREVDVGKIRDRINGLVQEFGLGGRISTGARDWSRDVGFGYRDSSEEYIRRVLIGNSQNFNYVEGGIPGLNAEKMWEWVREGHSREGLRKFNLVEQRLRKYDSICAALCKDMEKGSLEEQLAEEEFWNRLWETYGRDVVSKRVNLSRLMLKESGAKIWNPDKPEIMVDYNLLCAFQHFGVVNYKGDFQDTKQEVDEARKRGYKVMEGLIESGMDASWLDGALFFIGRELRKKGAKVCLYPGCTDY